MTSLFGFPWSRTTTANILSIHRHVHTHIYIRRPSHRRDFLAVNPFPIVKLNTAASDCYLSCLTGAGANDLNDGKATAASFRPHQTLRLLLSSLSIDKP